MSLRANMLLANIKTFSHTDAIEANFTPVTDDGIEENKRFNKYTPGGSLMLYVDNPSAAEQFKVGRFYYVDLTEAPAN